LVTGCASLVATCKSSITTSRYVPVKFGLIFKIIGSKNLRNIRTALKDVKAYLVRGQS
jgi:hypothetical protein